MLSRILFGMVFLSATPLSYGRPQLFQDLHNSREIPKTIAYIINQFLSNISIEIDFLISSESPSQTRLHLDTVNEVLQHLGMKTTVSLSGFSKYAYPLLIIADTHMAFRTALLSTGHNEYEFTGYFLVYITQPISTTDIGNIFKDCLEHQIINVCVIMNSIRDDIVLLTYFPFSQGNCFNHRPHVVCILMNGIFRTFDGNACVIYPDKLSNFHGCELIFNTYDIPPFLNCNTDRMGRVSVNGLEAEVIKTLAWKLNFKPTFLTIDKTQPNRVQMFTSGFANISIGRLRTTTIRRRNVSSSTAYCKSDLVVVTHSGRKLYSLERIFSPASSSVWLAFLFGLTAVYVLVIVVYRKFQTARIFMLGGENRYPTYWIWVTALGGPAEYRLRRNFARFLLMQWITLTFFLRSGYQTFIYKSIQMDWKISPVNSLVEFFTNGFYLNSSLDLSHSLSDISLLDGHVKLFNGSEIEVLQSLEGNIENGAVIVPEEIFRYYQQLVKNNKLAMIKEPLLEQMICMHFHTNSYLKGPIDRNLMLFAVSGLLEHWSSIYVPPLEELHSSSTVPTKISLTDVVAFFQVYAIAAGNSFIALGLELLSLKVRFLRKFFLI